MTTSKKIFVLLSLIVLSTLTSVESIAQWVSPTLSLTKARARMVAVTVGDKVYFAGGFGKPSGSNTVYNTIDVYDYLTGAITQLGTSLPTARTDMGGVYNSISNKIYFAGGQNVSGTKLDMIEIYNVGTGAFVSSMTLPHAAAYMCAASVGDRILFAGGSNGSSFYKEVYVYDVNTNQLLGTYDLSEARDQIAVAVIGNKVIMAGGHTGGGVLSDNVDVFDISTLTFDSNPPTLSTKRSVQGGASVGNYAVFGGGAIDPLNVNQGSTVVDIFDFSVSPATRTTRSLSQGRSYLAATSVGQKVFIASGNYGNNAVYDNVDIFDFTSGIPASPTLDHLTAGRFSLAAVSINSRAIFAGGGEVGDTYTAVVNVYDTDATAPLISSRQPAHNATNVNYTTDLAITFNERIKKGTGDITIKENGVVKQTIPIANTTISSDKLTLNIDLNGLKSGNEITIEMGPGVIEDLAGNDFAGLTSGQWKFRTATLVTSADATYFDVFEKDSAPKEITLTVSDASKVDHVKFYWRGISGDPANMSSIDAGVPTGNQYKVTLNQTHFNDAIGLYGYFLYTDITGGVGGADSARIYYKYPSRKSGSAIPNLKFGNTEDKYQMVSVPLQLQYARVDSVFKDLGSYNKKNWRLFRYSSNENRELTTSQSIEPGKGYWLIVRTSTEIKPGGGTTVKFSNESTNKPFVITLEKGWNQIGNPYNFAISWAEVLAANPLVADKLSVKAKVYISGTQLADKNKIDAYGGAFVENKTDQAIDVIIPVRKPDSIGDREASDEVDLSSYNWHLPINISDGIMSNGTGGIGMNKRATLTGRDNFDEESPPLPAEIGMFEIAFPHPEIGKDFAKEIVPTADSHVWDLQLHKTSDRPLTLTWDHTVFNDTDKELYIADFSFGVVKDMKAEGSITVPNSTNSLRIIFGSADFVKSTMDELTPLIGFPYPNPALDEVRVPFHIPSNSAKLDVHIEVVSAQGSRVATLADGMYENGSHEVVWKTSGKSGLFLVKTQVGTEQIRWTKVMVK